MKILPSSINRSRCPDHLRFEHLEKRMVLNASFADNFSSFDISNFSEVTELTISESEDETLVRFELNSGQWNGLDTVNHFGHGTPLLQVRKSFLEQRDELTIIDLASNQGANIVFSDIDLTSAPDLITTILVPGPITQTAGTSIKTGFLSVNSSLDEVALFEQGNVIATLQVSSSLNSNIQVDNLLDFRFAEVGGDLTIVAPAGIDGPSDARIRISGQLILDADAGIDLFTVDELSFNELNFNTTAHAGFLMNDVDQQVIIFGSNTANDLGVISFLGSIATRPGTEIIVSNDAGFLAEDGITLGNDPGDVFDVGRVASFGLRNQNAKVEVGDDGHSPGEGAQVNLTYVNFSVGLTEDVVIQVDFDTTIVGNSNPADTGPFRNFNTNKARHLTLISAGSITDEQDASMELNGTYIEAAGDIVLADDPNGNAAESAEIDKLAVAGLPVFAALGNISVGFDNAVNTEGSVASFGRVIFESLGHVFIRNESSLTFSGHAQAGGRVVIDAAGDFSNGGFDLTTGDRLDIIAAGDIEMGQGEIEIAKAAFFISEGPIHVGDQGGIANFGRVRFLSESNVSIVEQSDMRLFGINSADSLFLTSSGKITDSPDTEIDAAGMIELSADSFISLADHPDDFIRSAQSTRLQSGAWISVGSEGKANFKRLNFHAVESAIVNEQGSMRLFDPISAPVVVLTSGGSISDSTSHQLIVTDFLGVQGNVIFLADQPGELVDAQGLASFGADIIVIGDQGSARLGSLSFNSNNYVQISVDGSVHLDQDNSAAHANISASGGIFDTPAATIEIQGSLSLNSGGLIVVGDSIGNIIDVMGAASLFAVEGIYVGSESSVNFGTLTFEALPFVIISEDSATHLVGQLMTHSLVLDSAGYITDSDTAFYSIQEGKFQTATGLLLGDSTSNVLEICMAEFTAGDFVVVDEPANVMIDDFIVNSPVHDVNVDTSC